MKLKLMIIALALVQCGCASITSLKTTPRADIRPRDQAYARRIYGGVRTDWHEVNRWIPGPAWAWPVGIVVFLDLPFSAAVDTVALPFTVPYNLMRMGQTTSNQASQAIGAPQNRQQHSKMAPKNRKSRHFRRTTPIFWTQPLAPRKMKELNKALEAIGDKSPQPHR